MNPMTATVPAATTVLEPVTPKVPGAIIACRDCDALQTVGDPASPIRAVCFRCGAILVGGGRERLPRALAFTLAGLPLFIAANTLPLLQMEGRGGRVEATVFGSVGALLEQRMPVLAALVLLTTVVLPAMQLGGSAFLLVRRALGPGPISAATGPVFQLLEAIRPWTQVEILLFGILVAFVRLSRFFHVVPGAGLLCLVGFLLLGAVARASVRPS